MFRKGAAGLAIGVIGVLVAAAGIGVALYKNSESGGGEAPVTGVIKTIARTHDGQNFSEGMAFLHSDTLLVGDGNAVVAVVLGGKPWTVATVPSRGQSNFVRYISVSPDGHIYFTDDTGSVYQYYGGVTRVVFDHQISAADGLGDLELRGVAATADGSVYVADILGDRILRIPPVGKVRTVGGYIDQPGELDVDNEGRLYVADFDGHIYRIDPNGTMHLVFDLRSVRDKVDQQSGFAAVCMAFTPNDELVVSDPGGSRVYLVTHGVAAPILGHGNSTSSPDGVPATAASVSTNAIAVTTDYRLIVNEGPSLRIVQLTH